MQLFSLPFLGLLIATFIANWAFSKKIRIFVLILASLCFLFVSNNLFALIYALILALYTFAVGKILRNKKNSVLLVCCVPYILGFLFFRYFPIEGILAPIGLSFYTFRAISYCVEVQKKKCPRQGLLQVILYITFFPILTAGPIVRPKPFFEELNHKPVLDYLDAKNGFIQLCCGIVQKLVLADFLKGIITPIFSQPETTGITVLVAMVLYLFQLYVDFDAYSNIAIGISRMLGFHFPKNFNVPLLSTSIKEFWQRWHISLSSWLKDYIYIPLGGNRKGKARKYLNLLITFIVSGIWHGASLPFLVWGLANGVISILQDLTHFGDHQKGFGKAVCIAINFVVLVLLMNVFRSSSLEEYVQLFVRIGQGGALNLGITPNETIWLCVVLVITILSDLLRYRKDMITALAQKPVLLRWCFYAILILVTIVFGVYGPGYNANDFVYALF